MQSAPRCVCWRHREGCARNSRPSGSWTRSARRSGRSRRGSTACAARWRARSVRHPSRYPRTLPPATSSRSCAPRPPPPPGPTRPGRSPTQLNPEISVTGDVRAYAQRPGIQRDNFDPREFEVGFQSPLDPYSSTKIFVSLENGTVSVEEGYAYWTGLPGHIRFDIGKFRQQFGELNRWHLHAVPETEYPVALRAYLGDDGLAGTGISLYRAFGGLGTHEVTAQVTRSASDAELFGGGARPSYLVRLLNFWQLTRSAYMQVGATGCTVPTPTRVCAPRSAASMCG